jgi:uncharacterized protein (TIGR02145 family)
MRIAAINKVSFFATLVLIFFSLNIIAQDLNDFDGNAYKTASYGLQEWTASNLNVSHFRNGDAIPEAKTPEEWTNAAAEGKPAWCYYENDPENGKIYGKLYNWFAINDPRGLAPEGWHIPDNGDWRTLIKNLKGIDVASGKLKNKTGWKSKNGTNQIGFTAIPGGYRDHGGKFKELSTTCQWWSNSVPVDVKPSENIYSLKLTDFSPQVKYFEMMKGTGLSVRCIKD